LLSVALFYINNKTKLVEFTQKPWIGKLGSIFLIACIFGFCGIEGLSLWVGYGIYPAPLFMAALAIGLFCANQAIKNI
jgi:hypothetical protein